MKAVDLGIIDYGTALNIQTHVHDLRAGSWDEDILFVLEHEPVLTMGRRGGHDDLLVTEAELAQKEVPLYCLNRGGKITCHYPGQFVAYPVMGMERFQGDVPRFVTTLEEVIIQTLADFGVEGGRIPEHRGVFVGEDKIASIGIEIRDRVTLHGVSLNVREDLRLYRLFVPCGIRDKGVTFLEKVCRSGFAVSMESVKKSFLTHFARAFNEEVPDLMDRDAFERQYLASGVQTDASANPRSAGKVLYRVWI